MYIAIAENDNEILSRSTVVNISFYNQETGIIVEYEVDGGACHYKSIRKVPKWFSKCSKNWKSAKGLKSFGRQRQYRAE